MKETKKESRVRISRGDLKQMIREALTAKTTIQESVWTPFNDAIVKSLGTEMKGKKVYYFDPKSDLVHTLVDGKVTGHSKKAPHGSKAYKDYSAMAKRDPKAFFNFGAADEEIVTEHLGTEQ